MESRELAESALPFCASAEASAEPGTVPSPLWGCAAGETGRGTGSQWRLRRQTSISHWGLCSLCASLSPFEKHGNNLQA